MCVVSITVRRSCCTHLRQVKICRKCQDTLGAGGVGGGRDINTWASRVLFPLKLWTNIHPIVCRVALREFSRVYQPTNPTNQPINEPTDRPINQPTNARSLTISAYFEYVICLFENIPTRFLRVYDLLEIFLTAN